MRELGYWVVDRVIEHITSLDQQPALLESPFGPLAAKLDGELPRVGHDIKEGLVALADVAVPNQQHGDHPRYFARVPGPSSFPAVLGEWLGTGTQTVASSWAGGSGPSTVEIIVCNWIRDAVGLNPASEGVLLSGGSMANITAIITARTQRGEGVVYLTDQTHSSLKRGLIAMGVPAEHIRVLASATDFTMNPDDLREAIAHDIANGLKPTMVLATAGTTNTGAVDDFVTLREICDAHNMWLHVDGAYGGPAAITARGREVIKGLELVDSFVMDPHKWFFQPYDVACLLVAHPGALEHTFAMYPEYLADLKGEEPNLHNRSLELTRRSRAFKLWLTIRSYGIDVLGQAIDRGIALAEYAQHVVEQDELFEIVTPAQLGIINFVAPSASAAAHSAAATRITESGYAAVSTTVLKGQTVLRLCIINPRTTTADLDGTISRLASYLREELSKTSK
jgi:glutamate/tyrosine decarboxylase-like PLP-dependent enzyme